MSRELWRPQQTTILCARMRIKNYKLLLAPPSLLPAAALAVGLLLVAGCTTQPRQAISTPAVPEVWHSASTDQTASLVNTAEVTYWESLGDPLLVQLINEAITANPSSLSALSSLREARAARRQTIGSHAPQVSIGVGHQHGYDFESTTHSQTSSLSTDASWELDLWGKKSTQAATVQFREQAAKADYNAVRVSLAAEVASAYIGLRGDQHQLNNSRASAETEKQALQLERARVAAHRGDERNLSRLERSYAQSLASLPALEQRLLEGRRHLSVLLGRLPDTLEDLIGEQPRDLPTPPDSVYLPIPAETLRQRPDVQVAEQRLLATSSQCQTIAADRWPSLSLKGSLGNSANTIARAFDLSTMVANLSARLAYSLYDSGQTKSRIEQCEEQQQQAVLSYQQVITAAVKEVENALTGLTHTRQRIELLENTMSLLDVEEQWVKMELETGRVDYSDWLAIVSNRLALKQQLVVARVSELGYVVTLIKAVAGPWADKITRFRSKHATERRGH